MTKTGGRDRNIDFKQIFRKFAKFLLSHKRKVTFWQQNFLKPIYHTKHSISDGEKWQNLGFVAKFLTKFAFLTNEKISRNQKPRNCFGKTL